MESKGVLVKRGFIRKIFEIRLMKVLQVLRWKVQSIIKTKFMKVFLRISMFLLKFPSFSVPPPNTEYEDVASEKGN